MDWHQKVLKPTATCSIFNPSERFLLSHQFAFPPFKKKKAKQNWIYWIKTKFCLENSNFVTFYKLKDKRFYWWQESWDRSIWAEVLGARGCPSNRFSLSFDSWILLWKDRMYFIPSVSAEMQMSSIYHNTLILDSPWLFILELNFPVFQVHIFLITFQPVTPEARASGKASLCSLGYISFLHLSRA